MLCLPTRRGIQTYHGLITLLQSHNHNPLFPTACPSSNVLSAMYSIPSTTMSLSSLIQRYLPTSSCISQFSDLIVYFIPWLFMAMFLTALVAKCTSVTGNKICIDFVPRRFGIYRFLGLMLSLKRLTKIEAREMIQAYRKTQHKHIHLIYINIYSIYTALTKARHV